MKNRNDEPMDPSTFPDAENPDEVPMILVVEDDADYRWLIVSGLKDEYQVLEADNGKEGLEKALEHIPDLVITDLMMPIMDGVELCRQLKTRMETSHIPVVMLTAKTSVESQIEGLEVGADDYVTKPFNMLLLRTRVQNLLETRRLLRERFTLQQIQSAQAVQEPDALKSDALDAPVPHSRMDGVFWDQICKALEGNYADAGFDIESLSSELNMSQRTLQRKIKGLTNRTPVQLIGDCRLKKAVALLHDSTGHVTDIAFKVGFGDLSYFYRLFKKEYGMNPSQYRDKNL